MREYQQAHKALEKRNVPVAVKHFEAATTLDPEFFDAFYDLGTVHLFFGNVDSGIEQLQKAVIIDPESALPYSNLAVAYLKRHQYSEAERVASRAVDLDRSDTHGMFMLGVAMIAAGKFTEDAQRNLKRAAGDYPQANVWLALGLALQGKTANATNLLKTYLDGGDKSAIEFAQGLWQHIEHGGVSLQ
jgi:tetratricopeptide (TPR) repeat protein